mmetsp:Transcript_17604/g.40909  ORF Transcript_17604/g.40909 Transcript_17604/m.40909 type:complete len:99 (-) Transcript_17604:91-387(-)
MASQKDIQIEQAKALHQALKEMTMLSDKIEQELKSLAAEKTTVGKELADYTSKIQEIDRKLPPLKQQKDELTQRERQLESRYMQLLEANPTLVQVGRK